MPETVLTGHCLCGACRFELSGPANWIGHCYCESCRRATGSPMTTWLGQPNGHWRWTGQTPQSYVSSAGRERGFCGTCGTPMYYRTADLPDETHFFVALLADPNAVEPQQQFHSDERLPWLEKAHHLPNG
jgi:hypothetical protein